MTREDKLEAEAIGGSDQNCNPVRTVNKKCKANGNAAGGKQHGQNRGTKERKQKDKSKNKILKAWSNYIIILRWFTGAGRISPHDQWLFEINNLMQILQEIYSILYRFFRIRSYRFVKTF